ncbi:MAG: acetyl-CoA carboxylase biotin carboxyl carrier protein subunit [Deltaproteobacteria bacterium]|nr:MAG: acetyl-CoA carboxylase biotin carboxyl carrier protein subunit [Deltaproteobacteria bacterium]
MGRYRLTIGDKTFDVEILGIQGEQARVSVNGRTYEVKYQPLTPGAAAPAPPVPPRAAPPRPTAPARPVAAPPPPEKPAAAPAAGEPGAVTAPMPGSILEVLVQAGDRVEIGQTVVKLEAMKMENDLQSAIAGVVKEVRVSKGDNVSVGEVLVVISA